MLVFAPYNFCFLKTINYIEVQNYLFGINGLKSFAFHGVISGPRHGERGGDTAQTQGAHTEEY